jgi:signal transduction histidine kinase
MIQYELGAKEKDEEATVAQAIGAAVLRLLALQGREPKDGSFEPVARALAEEGVRLVPGAECVISVAPADQPQIFRVIAGVGPWAAPLVGREWPVHRGLLHGRAMLSGRTVETTDAPSDSLAPDVFGPGAIRTGRLVPITAGEGLPDGRVAMGVIGFWRPGETPFSSAERRLIDAYAAVVSGVLLRSEARFATERLVRRLRVSADVADRFSMSLDPRQVAEEIVEQVAGLVAADRATLLALHEGTVEVVGAYDRSGQPAPPGEAFAVTPPMRRAIRSGRILVEAEAPDLRGLPATHGSELRDVHHRITAPLAVGGTVVALLIVSRRSPEPFSRLDVENLAQIGSRAALALRTSSLYGEALAAKAKGLDALAQVSRHLEVVSSMPAFFGRVTATVAELVHARRAAFWRLDEGAHGLTIEADAFGVSPADLVPPRRVAVSAVGRRAVDRLVFAGESLLRRRSGSDADASWNRLALSGTNNLMAVPWRTGIGELGVLAAYDSSRVGGFTDEDLWVLRLSSLVAGLVWQLKDAEGRLQRMGEQEKRLLEDHVARVTALEKTKSDFLKLASHELRTPLAVIRGYLDMLADGSIDAAAFADRLPVIIGRVLQMGRLIGEMLETARLEEEQLALDLQTLDLRTIVTRATDTTRPLLASGHVLRVRLSRRPIWVRVDSERIENIIVNLLDNAIKYSPSGGSIEVRAAVVNGAARVSVSDHGLGIDRRDMSKLFTRFGRLVTRDNSHITGTGLGLYLAQQLAERHGGRITVRSEPHRGSRFTLTLPVVA